MKKQAIQTLAMTSILALLSSWQNAPEGEVAKATEVEMSVLPQETASLDADHITVSSQEESDLEIDAMADLTAAAEKETKVVVKKAPAKKAPNRKVAAKKSKKQLAAKNTMTAVSSKHMEAEINSIEMKDVHDTMGGKIPPHHQLNPDSCGFFFTVDFLYWQANEDNLEPFTKFSGVNAPMPDVQNSFLPGIDRKVYDMNFKWNPGFRIGLGGQLSQHDDWDLYLNYTFMRNHAHRTKSTDVLAGEALIPGWSPNFFGQATDFGTAKWSLHYNTLDLEMGRDYFAGTNLTIHPHVGLRGAGLLQDYHVAYDIINYVSTVPQVKMDAKCNFWGLGIRGGADMLWHFTKNWGIYGQLTGALIYGHFNVKENTLSIIPATNAPFISIGLPGKTHEQFWRMRTTLQTGLGLTWEMLCNHDKCRVSLSLGYEFNEWFNQNQFINQYILPLNAQTLFTFTETHQGGDLAFQGIDFNMRFDF